MKIKTKSTKIFPLIIAFIFLINAAISLPFPKKQQELLDERYASETENSSGESGVEKNTTTDDTSSFVMVDEIFDSSDGTFSYTNINTLLQYITGDSSTTAFHTNYLDTLATKTQTAKDIRANVVGNKTSSQDVQVTFGGLTWQVMYLSKDSDGNVILTLWLSTNVQEAWTDRTSDEGEYYGYVNGGLYSDWSADWSDETLGTYPSNMYGTSYINAVTLNNGGYYATSNSAITTATQSADSAFAIFTMTQDELDSTGSSLTSLTDFLVTPRSVSWQETENAYPKGFGYTASNDAYGSPSGKLNWYGNSSTYNYINYAYYDSWADSYVWLPSVAETGYDSTYDGIWETSTYQRQNSDDIDNSYIVGYNNENSSYPNTINNFSWLRSASYRYSYYSRYIEASGDDYYRCEGYYACAVRPAIHLNLTAAIRNVNIIEYNSTDNFLYFEDGYMPQSMYGTDGQTAPENVNKYSALWTYTIRLSTSNWASVLIYSGTEEDYAYVTIYSGSNVEVASAWFVVEPIIWVVAYGEDTPASATTAVTAQIVTAGYVCSSADSTFSWAMSSMLGMSVETLEGYLDLSYASVGDFTYDSFNGTNSQNVVDDETTTLSSKIAVASISEIDALGGSYKATCTDFVAFLLSGGSITSGYAVEYWTRDLAYSLDSSSYYGTSSSSGYYNNGVYVTSAGKISNAWLSNCFGARLSMSI